MKKSKLTKLLSVLLLGTTVMTFASPVVANAAWKKNSIGWWYTEGNSWATGWRQIGGLWYYFDNNGYMKTGWIKDKGTWYYLDKSGAMKTGWIKDDSGHMPVWYYTNSSGAMQTGWVKVNYNWYYFNSDGSMKKGWLVENGKHYFLDEYNGDMKTGFYMHHPEVSYYFDKSGASASGWTTIDGNTYYLEEYNEGYKLAINTIVDGHYLNYDGVKDNNAQIKVKNKDEALKLISLQDSEFINKVNSENSNIVFLYNKEVIRIDHNLSVSNDSRIMNEGSYSIIVEDSETAEIKYEYLVGMLSGKVYVSKLGNIYSYEINNNKVVTTFKGNYNDSFIDLGTDNWR